MNDSKQELPVLEDAEQGTPFVLNEKFYSVTKNTLENCLRVIFQTGFQIHPCVRDAKTFGKMRKNKDGWEQLKDENGELLWKKPKDPLTTKHPETGKYTWKVVHKTWTDSKKAFTSRWNKNRIICGLWVGSQKTPDVIVLDFDVKTMPPAEQEEQLKKFNEWAKKNGWPEPFLVYRTISGSYHLYYFAGGVFPDKAGDLPVKTESGYGSFETRGGDDDGGYVVLWNILELTQVCKQWKKFTDNKEKYLLTLEHYNSLGGYRKETNRRRQRAKTGETEAIPHDFIPWTVGYRHATIRNTAWDIACQRIADPVKRSEVIGTLKTENKEQNTPYGDEEVDRLIESAEEKLEEKEGVLLKDYGTLFLDMNIQGACERFLRILANDLLVVQHQDHSEILKWNEYKWTNNKEEILIEIIRNERNTAEKFAYIKLLDHKEFKKWMEKLQSQDKVKKVYENQIREYRLMDERPSGISEVKGSAVNRNDNWLVFANGARRVAGKGKTTMSVEEMKGLHHTAAIDYPFDPDAQDYDVDTLFQGKEESAVAIAKSMFGGVDKFITFHIGESNAGKTTFFECIVAAMQCYAAISNMQFLTHKNETFETSWYQILQGQRLAFGSDTVKKGIKNFPPERVKGASGQEFITLREIKQAIETVRSNYSLHLSENEVPQGLDVLDPAIKNRVRFVRFPMFAEGDRLSDELIMRIKTDTKCHQAIMAKLVKLANNDKPRFPDQTEIYKEAMRKGYAEWLYDLLQKITFVKDDDSVLSTTEVWNTARTELGGDALPHDYRRKFTEQIKRYIRNEFDGLELTEGHARIKTWEGIRIETEMITNTPPNNHQKHDSDDDEGELPADLKLGCTDFELDND